VDALYETARGNNVVTRYLPKEVGGKTIVHKDQLEGIGSTAYVNVEKMIKGRPLPDDPDDLLVKLIASPKGFAEHRKKLIAANKIVEGTADDKELLAVMEMAKLCMNPTATFKGSKHSVSCGSIGKFFFPDNWTLEDVTDVAKEMLDAPANSPIMKVPLKENQHKLVGKFRGIWVEMVVSQGKVTTFYPAHIQDESLLIAWINVTKKELN